MIKQSDVETLREALARIAEGNVIHEHYRTWPHWNPGGNLSVERDVARLAIATAAAIRTFPIPEDAMRDRSTDSATLPGDVIVAPATIILKGASIKTLMLALQQREGRDVGPIYPHLRPLPEPATMAERDAEIERLKVELAEMKGQHDCWQENSEALSGDVDKCEKTIAWLRAELTAALGRCRYDMGMDIEHGPIGCSLDGVLGASCHCRFSVAKRDQYCTFTKETRS